VETLFTIAWNTHLVSRAARELGFEPIDAGELSIALYAEMLRMFAVRLAPDAGFGRTISFRAFQAVNAS
jgi:predicted dinucleotide-binding enzyme